MADDDSYNSFERACKGGVIGCAVLLGVVVLGITASLCKGSFTMETWGTAVEFVLIAGVPCAVTGAIGGIVCQFGRASAYGMILSLCMVGMCLWLGRWSTWLLFTHLIVFATAMGALIGGAGALMGRTVLEIGAATRQPRLSMMEFLITGLLSMAILTYILSIT